ncbi:hypothetical protein BsIDN1_67750 [Bacillus safensis]|uniref:Uncharacterized protein n=1 Tax=Bacillus safensis TaxID=561879 RepID=A0A5S9MI87_BACIA|nr:hypothetical protein BsIDN1_67750 [Bacillus safensis]
MNKMSKMPGIARFILLFAPFPSLLPLSVKKRGLKYDDVPCNVLVKKGVWLKEYLTGKPFVFKLSD